MSSLTRVLTIVGAIGSAVAAGAFMTFSTFTIGGLRRLAPSEGASAMQSINRQATTPLFMLVLFGTAATCVGLAVQAVRHPDEPFRTHRLVACAAYLIGVVGLTVGYHVPRNDLLAAVDADSADGLRYWATYLDEWVRMNHVRTVVPMVTSVVLTLSLSGD
jgi:uncharacterized membrane protein